ncbi:MAG: hypothetical protein LBQ47_08865, partial [Endomicrobium sp.]|nr:hypothetical protein [Endomicrobium sp.]
GNPSLLKNSFYIVFLKEIMLETILILKMDSHFHGNDRHEQNRRSLCFIKQAKPVVSECLSVCHSRENGNPSLLKNSFYIVFLKEIMLETILILKMDSHFHGNDRLKQNRYCLCSIKQTKSEKK